APTHRTLWLAIGRGAVARSAGTGMAGAARMNLWQQLHFLRPEWLWALLLVPLALLGSSYLQRRRSRWHEAVDAHLLSHLLTGTGKRRWWGRVALSLGLLLAVLA